jgi:nucleoside-diphosphate-sugar epimerase
LRILVTGANGLVGSAVCRRLVAEGWTVFGAVRREVSLPAGTTPRRIGEIGPDTVWAPVLAGIDAVVHLAARVHVLRATAGDPDAAFDRANAQGTLCLATAAAALGLHRFVFMSSIKVNGEGTGERPFRPEDPPAPADAYARSKWQAEQGLHRLAAANSHLKVTILRPPLVYGPGVGGNFCRLLAAVARGWPLPVGAVDNRRSLIYAANLADAVAACLDEPAGACETFLVSDGEAVSTAELIRRLARLMGRQPRLARLPPGLLRLAGRCLGQSATVDRLIGSLVVDDEAFRRRFAWTPPYGLEAGLAETAAWFLRSA